MKRGSDSEEGKGEVLNEEATWAAGKMAATSSQLQLFKRKMIMHWKGIQVCSTPISRQTKDLLTELGNVNPQWRSELMQNPAAVEALSAQGRPTAQHGPHQ